MKKKSRFLQTPIEPFAVEAGLTADEVLARMERISFQGRNLATAHRIWQKMLQDDVTIFLGMAGAVGRRPAPDRRAPDLATATSTAWCRPARTSITTCTKRAASATTSARRTPTTPRWPRTASTACTTPTRARKSSSPTTTGSPTSPSTLEPRPYTTREFLHLLGGHLWKTTGRDGILTAAYRANVPIFCPAIADSSIGMGLSQARQKKAGAGHIDIIGDIVESANLVIRRPRTASVVLGGGTPKNFINQASVQAEFYSDEVGGHRYALQIVTDVPHFGGASGSSLEEAQSWGKLATDSARVSVQADATIALPLLASALATTAPPLLAPAQDAGIHPGRPRHDGRRPDRSQRALRGSE